MHSFGWHGTDEQDMVYMKVAQDKDFTGTATSNKDCIAQLHGTRAVWHSYIGQGQYGTVRTRTTLHSYTGQSAHRAQPC